MLFACLFQHGVNNSLAQTEALLMQRFNGWPDGGQQSKLFGLEQNSQRADFPDTKLIQFAPSFAVVFETTIIARLSRLTL
jgi:hypothetical protein